jgi:sugar-specific transcriptional regulator TrmB
MIKEIVLKFEIDENSFKDGNLLLYNKDRHYFYATSPEMFLHRQDNEIKKLKREYEEKEQKMKQKVEELENQYKEFLVNYQASNEKLLNMVESFIKAYGGKGI